MTESTSPTAEAYSGFNKILFKMEAGIPIRTGTMKAVNMIIFLCLVIFELMRNESNSFALPSRIKT